MLHTNAHITCECISVVRISCVNAVCRCRCTYFVVTLCIFCRCVVALRHRITESWTFLSSHCVHFVVALQHRIADSCIAALQHRCIAISSPQRCYHVFSSSRCCITALLCHSAVSHAFIIILQNTHISKNTRI